MAILSDLESTGEGFALWEEFSAAVSADRRVQVITSGRIDSLCTGPRHYLDRQGNNPTAAVDADPEVVVRSNTIGLL